MVPGISVDKDHVVKWTSGQEVNQDQILYFAFFALVL